MVIETKAKIKFKKNDHIKKPLYNWIINHPQVVQSPIFNDCMKVNIYGHTRPQIVPKFSLQVSLIELYNSHVSNTVDGGIKVARDVDNNIITSDSTIRALLPPQLKNVITIQGHVWL